MSIVAEKIDFKERPPESPALQAKDKGVTYLAPLASAMAASSGDDVPTQLAALLGREIFRIRKTDETPPRVSIIDVTRLPGVCAASPISTPKWGQIGSTCYRRRRAVNRQENVEPFGHPC